MVKWQNIQTVLLDMDGTLLDLNFDNYFWRHYVPQCFAEKHGIPLESAKDRLFPMFREKEGTMDWYCVDYWTRELGLDIELLKHEVDHLIDVHPHVVNFLVAVRKSGRRLALVTNAHGKSLRLKMKRTQIGDHFDDIVCAHDFSIPKEVPQFWDKLQHRVAFDRNSTLLVDDSLSVLRSAREYGIDHLLAVSKPDTRQPVRSVTEFPAIHDFSELMPVK